MVDSSTAVFGMAGMLTFLALLIVLAAWRLGMQSKTHEDRFHFVVGAAAALPLIFLFWCAVLMVGVWIAQQLGI